MTIPPTGITYFHGFHDTILWWFSSYFLDCCFSFTYCVRVPKNRLEELIGLRKVGMLMVMVYYSEMIQIKISKGKRSMEKIPEENRHKVPGVSSQCSCTGTNSPSNDVRPHLCALLPNREVHPSLGIQGFYFGGRSVT